MIFKHNEDSVAYENKPVRIIKHKFLIFPKTIGNETRWLECASFECELVRYYKFWSNGGIGLRYEPVNWL